MFDTDRMGKVRVTRRDALKIAGAAGVMAALPWGNAPEAAPAPPALKGAQSGGYYRFTVGDAEGVVISDGGLSFQPIQPTWAPEASKEDVEATLRSAFLPTDRIQPPAVPRDRPRAGGKGRRLRVGPGAVELGVMRLS